MYNHNLLVCFADSAGSGYTYWAISIAEHEDSPETTGESMKQFILDTLHERATEDSNCQFVIDLVDATPIEHIHLQRSQQFNVVGPSFVSKDKKVVLVGDAAHSMSPSYGQGANFAFEDAISLALAIKSSTDVNVALDMYSESRVERCRDMVRKSSQRWNQGKGSSNANEVLRWISKWEPPAFE